VVTGVDGTDSGAGADPASLGTYLNDHLGGATGGLELFRRAHRTHRGTPAEPALERLAGEIAEDRAALLRIMSSLGVPVRRYKVLGGWVAEKVTRLKPNGGVLQRSPLSSVIELESMHLGVQGKAAGWRALRRLADTDPRLDAGGLDALLERADRQSEVLEQLRMDAVTTVFVSR